MPRKNINKFSARNLIKKIKDGLFDPKLLKQDQRQLCVETLMFEGLSQAAMAEFFKVDDRTIRRDAKDIYKRNVSEAVPELNETITGELLMSYKCSRTRIAQLARSPDISTKDKAHMEFLSWKILKEFADLLNSLGYLKAIRDVSHLVKKPRERKYPKSENQKKIEEHAATLTGMERERYIYEPMRHMMQKFREEHIEAIRSSAKVRLDAIEKKYPDDKEKQKEKILLLVDKAEAEAEEYFSDF